MTKFFVDYNKPALASEITWALDLKEIKSAVPFIDFIRCDDGEDFQFLNSSENDFKVLKINQFAFVQSEDRNRFFLCYTADFEIDLKEYSKFLKALNHSNNEVEVVLGFKKDNKILTDCFEEYENKTCILQKF
jgi:hypothetical protein